WQAFVRRLPDDVVLVANADDPRVCQLAAGHPNLVLVGMDAFDRIAPAEHADVPDCLRCGSRVRYEGAHIGHLGRWSCPSCGDRRPDRLDVEARHVSAPGTGTASFVLAVRRPDHDRVSEWPVALAVPGRFNVAN